MINANDVFVVYKITNLVNGKLYFGVTKCGINTRWNQHKHAGIRKKKQTFLANAIGKYGHKCFKIETVKNCANEFEMYELEKELISKYRTNDRNYGYNNSIGGEISSKGMRHSEKTKALISAIQKNRKRGPHSDMAKENMRKAAMGRDMSKVYAASVLKRKGVPLSKERKAMLSIAGKEKNSIPVLMLNKNGDVLNSFSSITKASKVTGISQPSISNVLTNRSKTAGGYIWQYQQAV